MSVPAQALTVGCSHPRRQPIWGGVLERCSSCGLVSTAKKPDFEYAEDYFVEGGGGYDFDSPFSRAFDAERFERELDELEASGLSGSLLDVGCAVGTFLSHAKARGWEIAGVELAGFARDAATRRLGIAVQASLDALPRGQRYDVVTLHHVLEHIHDPAGFLAREVAPRVGRLLWIEVPNFASLAAQTEGPRWKDLRPEQHVNHFEPHVLAALVEAAGFQVLRVRTLMEPLWSLRAGVRTLVTLRALAGPRRFGPEDFRKPEPAAAPRWVPPRGLHGAAVLASRIAFAPLARWIERTQRAERLVVEAQPKGSGS